MRENKLTTLYGVYDMKNEEQCLFVGNSRECAEYLGIKRDSLWSAVSRKQKRIRVCKIGEEDEI